MLRQIRYSPFHINFQDNHVIRNFAEDRLPLQADFLDFSIAISGPDVFNTVSSMVGAAPAEGKAGYFPKDAPSWVRNMANRGRNVIELERKRKKENLVASREGEVSERVATNSVLEDDLASVAASDLTMAQWR